MVGGDLTREMVDARELSDQRIFLTYVHMCANIKDASTNIQYWH